VSENNYHILLVDDDRSFINRIRFGLPEEFPSLNVHIPVSVDYLKKNKTLNKIGHKAINWIDKRFDEKLPIDSVFLDIRMKNFSGREVLKVITDKYKHLPVVMMTSHEELVGGQNVSDYLKCGAKAYLNKHSKIFNSEVAVWTERLTNESKTNLWTRIIEEFSRIVHDTKNIEWREVINIICDQLTKYHMIDSCYFRRYHKEENILELVSDPKFITTKALHNPKNVDANQIGMLRDLVKKKEPIIENNLSKFKKSYINSDTVYDRYVITNFKMLGFPIIYNNNTLGTFTMFRSPEASNFTNDDLVYAQILTDHIALFLGETYEKKSLKEEKKKLVNDRKFLRRRASILLDIVERFSECKSEKEIYDILTKHLHYEINSSYESVNIISKSTFKLLHMGSLELELNSSHGAFRDRWEPDIETDKGYSILAVKKRKSYIVKNKEKDGKEFWYTTNKNMVSSLTVPLLTTEDSGCLGVINLESSKEGHFTINDKEYAESLCRTAATMITVHKTREFLKKAFALSEHVSNPEKFLENASHLIFELTGFETILIVTKKDEENTAQGWEMSNLGVRDKNNKDKLIVGSEIDSEIYSNYKELIENEFEKTLINHAYKTNKNISNYDVTSNKYPFCDPIESKRKKKIKSQVVYLLKAGEETFGIMSLEYVISNPLTVHQKEILEKFTPWVADISMELRRFTQLKIASEEYRRQAVISLYMRQFRHELANLGLKLENLLPLIKKDKKNIKIIEKHLPPIIEQMKGLKNNIYSVGKLSIKRLNLKYLWEAICDEHKSEAERINVVLKKLNKSVYLNMDYTILRMTLFNIVENSLNIFSLNMEIKNRTISLKHFISENNKFDCIAIIDTGIGIKKEYLYEIFSEGFTTTPHGSGFGLFYVKQSLERCDSIILVDPNYKEGASFIIKIPRKIVEKKNVR